jgi:predicted Na+-dependent transporter
MEQLLQRAFPISRLSFFILWYFIYKRLKLQAKDFKFHLHYQRNHLISLVSRQGVVSILAIILNHTLYSYGGEHSIIVWHHQ